MSPKPRQQAPQPEFRNALGQPIGFPVENWRSCARPPRTALAGRTCRVEPLDPERHAAALHGANLEDRENRIWTYLPYGPFATLADYRAWMAASCLGDDPLFHAVVDTAHGAASGVASYLRIDPPVGVIEVGHINFAPRLQNTTAATEAMYLMMRRAFAELGYRRYEWKCDALNAASRRAAERLGFRFEGVFRQATLYKGRNRDTAWYAVIDRDWPGTRDAFEAWLDPGNFDADGHQRGSLATLMARRSAA
ncbi:MAG TPA: GNAT family protein [Kiloniellales bacterium]